MIYVRMFEFKLRGTNGRISGASILFLTKYIMQKPKYQPEISHFSGKRRTVCAW